MWKEIIVFSHLSMVKCSEIPSKCNFDISKNQTCDVKYVITRFKVAHNPDSSSNN